MSINKILKMLDLRIRDNASGVFAPESMNTLRAYIRELEARSERAEAENKRLKRQCTDRAYMAVALENMLGPKGKQVAEMWKAKGVQRVHLDWGCKAHEMTGEQRAQAILEFEAAALAAMEATDE